jgi:hypothetical protein
MSSLSPYLILLTGCTWSQASQVARITGVTHQHLVETHQVKWFHLGKQRSGGLRLEASLGK